MGDLIELPYGGSQPNSGHAGSETSEARAVTADSDGTTKERQARTLEIIAQAGAGGVTWKELSEALSIHHGASSGVLSVLHKAGKIARLDETRQKCKVYVGLGHVGIRKTEAQGQTATVVLLNDLAKIVAEQNPRGCEQHAAQHADWFTDECVGCRAVVALRKWEARA